MPRRSARHAKGTEEDISKEINTARLMNPLLETCTNSQIQEQEEQEEEEEEKEHVAISVDVTNFEVSTKVNSLQESALSLARSHHFQDLSEESYLSAFESPEAWEKTPEEERQLYTNTWLLAYLKNRCGSRGVDRKSLDYYETPGLRHAIRDAVERKHASKEKKRLRDLASYSFKKFQEQAYLSSRNPDDPDVAKGAAEKKEA